MSEKVYFLEVSERENEKKIAERLIEALNKFDVLSFIKDKDMVAVKSHFGENKFNGVVDPLFLKVFGDLIKGKGGNPFMTETSTLYKGNRTNAVDHIHLAEKHGFTIRDTGMPVIMADGLFGDEESEVEIPGKIYKTVNIASLLSKIQAMIVVTHFTGHIVAGYGGALKNIGMGLSSRRGKMIQHSTSKPSIKKKKCTSCGECIRWCPVEAISFVDGKAWIDKDICIGCAECLAVCRFDAVAYNWSESYDKLQQKITEHAMGVVKTMEGRSLYINFLLKVSKDCDCMNKYEKVAPDVGILFSKDPVALDAASIDLVEKKIQKKLSQISYDIPYRVQLEHAEEIGFGDTEYELIPVD
ncbi:MAG: DUF362 domain-containing protein [Acidobacteriota bacterium]